MTCATLYVSTSKSVALASAALEGGGREEEHNKVGTKGPGDHQLGRFCPVLSTAMTDSCWDANRPLSCRCTSSIPTAEGLAAAESKLQTLSATGVYVSGQQSEFAKAPSPAVVLDEAWSWYPFRA